MRKLGWKRQKPDARDFRVASPVDVVEGYYDLSPWFPPCIDQGDNNSCTGASSGGAYHYLARSQGMLNFTPSRMFIYYNARKYEGDIDQDDGAEIRDAIKTITKLGVPDESVWPSDNKNLHNEPPPEVYAEAKKTALLQYAAIPDDVNTTDKQRRILSCLSHRIPVIFGFMVFKGAMSARAEKTGVIPDPKPNEDAEGGHAVVIVGYDPVKRLYKIRNSWGASWGKNGYGYLSESYVHDPNLSGDFWATFLIQKPPLTA